MNREHTLNGAALHNKFVPQNLSDFLEFVWICAHKGKFRLATGANIGRHSFVAKQTKMGLLCETAVRKEASNAMHGALSLVKMSNTQVTATGYFYCDHC